MSNTQMNSSQVQQWPGRAEYCEMVRSLDDSNVESHVRNRIFHDKLPPFSFFDSLPADHQADAYRAIAMVSHLSYHAIIPKTTQIEAALACVYGCDCVVIAGTGFGKTLIVIMMLLLRPLRGSLLISPLKRIQKSQVRKIMY